VNTRVTPLGSAARRSYDRQQGHVKRVTVFEAGLGLTCCYGLIGAGVGAAAGATLVGLIAGLGIGLLAVAAILLVSGAAVSSREVARGVLPQRGGTSRPARTTVSPGEGSRW
jgi:hypothetical protein